MATATVIHREVGTRSHESPFVSRVKPPEPFTLVLFGATGNFAGRKLLPALASLIESKYLPADFVIVGIGPRDKTDQALSADVQKDLAEFRKNVANTENADFIFHVVYQRSDFTTLEGMKGLAERVHALERESVRQSPVQSGHRLRKNNCGGKLEPRVRENGVGSESFCCASKSCQVSSLARQRKVSLSEAFSKRQTKRFGEFVGRLLLQLVYWGQRCPVFALPKAPGR
jgi:hypothetical protein